MMDFYRDNGTIKRIISESNNTNETVAAGTIV